MHFRIARRTLYDDRPHLLDVGPTDVDGAFFRCSPIAQECHRSASERDRTVSEAGEGRGIAELELNPTIEDVTDQPLVFVDHAVAVGVFMDRYGAHRDVEAYDHVVLLEHRHRPGSCDSLAYLLGRRVERPGRRVYPCNAEGEGEANQHERHTDFN